MQLAPLGHDVRPRATLHHADVYRHSGPSPVQLVQSDRRVGRLQRRGATPLRLDPSVGGAPLNRQVNVGDPLSRRDDVTVLAGSLQHEARVRLLRSLEDVRSAERRADLLVGIADVGD